MTGMNRTIKTKETVLNVKTADHKKNLAHYMKQSSIRSKQSSFRNKEDQYQKADYETSPQSTAIDDIQTTWKKSVYESKFRAERRIRQYRQYRAEQSNMDPVTGQQIRQNRVPVIRRITAPIRNSYQMQMVRNTIHHYAESFRTYNRFTAAVSSIFSGTGKVLRIGSKALKGTAKGLSTLVSAGSGVLLIITMTLFFGMFSSFTNTSVLAQGIEIPEASVQPDFTNDEAWGENNPYTRLGFTGQCTWFAWGRFYEIYGYDPGFTGDGWSCASQLVAAHPDKFELSYAPAAGAVFSTIGHNHVGIVIAVDGDKITIQDGNLDGVSNTFLEAMTDWKEETMTIDAFVAHHGGVIYAVPKLIESEQSH